MISPMRMFALKFKSYAFRPNILRYLLIIAAPVMIICMGLPALFWIIILYLLLSAANKE